MNIFCLKSLTVHNCNVSWTNSVENGFDSLKSKINTKLAVILSSILYSVRDFLNVNIKFQLITRDAIIIFAYFFPGVTKKIPQILVGSNFWFGPQNFFKKAAFLAYCYLVIAFLEAHISQRDRIVFKYRELWKSST